MDFNVWSCHLGFWNNNLRTDRQTCWWCEIEIYNSLVPNSSSCERMISQSMLLLTHCNNEETGWLSNLLRITQLDGRSGYKPKVWATDLEAWEEEGMPWTGSEGDALCNSMLPLGEVCQNRCLPASVPRLSIKPPAWLWQTADSCKFKAYI